MPLIFQPGWEQGRGLGLQDWPDGEVQWVKVRVPCRPDFLAYEWGDFPLNAGLGGLGSMRERRVLLQGPGNSLKVLLGPGQQVTLQHIGDIALGVQLYYRGHKKQREPPSLCDSGPNHDRLRILSSGDNSSLCRWRGNSIKMTRKHLLNVEFLLVRKHEVRHLLEDFPAFLAPHGHMIGRKLLAKGFTPDHPSTPVAWWICSHRLRWPRFCSFGKGFVAAFPSCFKKLRGADTPFPSAPWSVKSVSGLLELLHNLPHRWTFISSRFAIWTLLFSLLWSLIIGFGI